MTNQKYWRSILGFTVALEQSETQIERKRIINEMKALTIAQLALLY